MSSSLKRYHFVGRLGGCTSGVSSDKSSVIILLFGLTGVKYCVFPLSGRTSSETLAVGVLNIWNK